MFHSSRAVQELPDPSGDRLAVRLIPGAERAVREGHPWVFDRSIKQVHQDGRPGDLAVIFDRKNRFLAVGLYDPHSPIRVRVLQHGTPEPIDDEWFDARLREAWARRAPLREQDTTGFRMVHGENDRLPGLVVDRYADSLVIKLYTSALVPYLRAIIDTLTDLLAPERIVLRLSRAVQKQGELHGLRDGLVLSGAQIQGAVLFRENGLVFEADLIRGQKTGFFLDQRENRARVEPLCAGRRVLNVFAYTGGFSLYAARGGAREVTSLDVSRPALAAAERNFAHNSHDRRIAAAKHSLLAGDAFRLLRRAQDHGERYEVVIIDPPAFAKAKDEIDRAAASYRTLVRLGLGVLASDGHLVFASCSSRIRAVRFASIIDQAARDAGRTLQVLQQTAHTLDHPIGFTEGEYLKCIFAAAA
jgi:23S rRNA (cytosine1962-C5)-methyltransferase